MPYGVPGFRPSHIAAAVCRGGFTTDGLGNFTQLILDSAVQNFGSPPYPSYDTDSMLDLVNGRIYVPAWANFVQVYGKITYAATTDPLAVTGIAACHLWRNDVSTTEMQYHTKQTLVPASGKPVSVPAQTPIIPILHAAGLEYWTLVAEQTTGKPLGMFGAGFDTYLAVNFYE